MNNGFNHNVPLAILELGAAGAVGNDARPSGCRLDVVARACAGEGVAWHQQCELVGFGLIDYGKRTALAVHCSELKDRVSGLIL